ncbi:MAG: L-threonylcarbamoyladenylate synthase [archaeon]
MAVTFKQAVAILKKGGIVGYPTETLYGLGVRIDNLAAIGRLKKLKGRDGKKPFLIALPGVRSIPKYAHATRGQLAFLREILPGPVAVLLKRKATVPPEITGGSDLVGIRIPANRLARALAKSVGAITSTSANPAGKRPATSASQVERELGILSVVPGACKYGKPSTLMNVSTGKILREGAYSAEKLAEIWGRHFSEKRQRAQEARIPQELFRR